MNEKTLNSIRNLTRQLLQDIIDDITQRDKVDTAIDDPDALQRLIEATELHREAIFYDLDDHLNCKGFTFK